MEEGFIDSYVMVWTLKDENGLVWEETYDELPLSGFEEIYGMNVHQILKVEMRSKSEPLPDND